jgi:phosphatidylglycerol:prolipoprotein diacylglycerol transferase
VGAFTFAGGWKIYFFPIFIGISAIIGLVWVYEKAPIKKASLFLDSGVGILLVTLIGSRIGYVIFQWHYFKAHLIEIPQFQLGGYTWAGAVIGWIAAIFVASRLLSLSMFEVSDVFLPLVGCLVIGMWLGCWFEGIAYGFVSNVWWALPAVDEWGEISYRFPVQFIGAIATLVFLMMIDGIKAHPVWKRWLLPPGKPAVLFLLVLSLEIFLSTFLRNDPTPLWMGRRLDFWISLGFSVIGMIGLGVLIIQQKLVFNKRKLSISGI